MRPGRLLGLGIAVILVAAACGSTDPVPDPISLSPESFEAMESEELSAEATRGIVSGGIPDPDFNSDPATSGPYADRWAGCGNYRQAIPEIYLVHSLRRGSVVINYQPALELAEVVGLEELVVEIGGGVLAAPKPGLDHPIVLSAWTKLLPLEEFDRSTIRAFVDQFGQSAPDNQVCPLEIDEAG
ncbi:MAG TPA: DUF3105 domain-containing protein [Actinobacteria bacterium]|nr:DUF3105 domain-containing protein [Actinomycetota bacterium]